MNTFYEYLGNFDAARDDYEQAIQRAHAAGEKQEEWQSLMGLWWLWDSHNDLPLDDLSKRLLDLAQSLDDPLKVALTKNQLAHWLVYSGQPEAGFAMHEEALAALQHHGERQHVALTLQFLGQAAAYAGDLRRALLYFDQAIALARTIGDQRTLAGSLMLRGYTTSPAFKEPVFSAPATLTACQRDLQEARRLDDEIEFPTGQPTLSSIRAWYSSPLGSWARGSPMRAWGSSLPPSSRIGIA